MADLNRITGRAMVGLMDGFGNEVVYYQKFNRPDEIIKYSNVTELYFILDSKGNLFIRPELAATAVILRGVNSFIFQGIYTKTAFGFKGNKKYFPRSELYGFLTNYDQYKNMIYHEYSGRDKRIIGGSHILLTPLEVVYLKNKQLKKRKKNKEDYNARK